MSPEQQREWEQDSYQPCTFPQPLAEVLTRENRELRAEVAELREDVARYDEWLRDRIAKQEAAESDAESAHREAQTAWRAAVDREVRAERAEAELADATTAAQNLRDELQGAQERLRRVREMADKWADSFDEAADRGEVTPVHAAILGASQAIDTALDAEP